jgi:predicted GNAT family N-acyltransferase
METECIHAFMLDENKEAQAVCRLQFNTPEIGQIRYMAVAEAQQGKGLGKEILTFLEDIAISKGISTMVLDARKNAVPFYWECGYYITARGYLLFDSIQHFRMEKRL